MVRYVNHHAMDEVFAVVEAEVDPSIRADLLAAIRRDVVDRILNAYEQTAYELKKRGDNIGQISDLLHLSERRIKRMISDYTSRTGAWNPLARRSSEGAVDITELVMKRP